MRSLDGPSALLRRVLADPLTLLVVGAFGLVFALFPALATGPTDRTATTLAAVPLTDDDGDAALFNAQALRPGRPVASCLAVTADPSADGQVYLSAQVTDGGLAPHLQLLVQSGTGGQFGDCTGFTPAATAFDGTLAQLATPGGVDTGWQTGTGGTRTFRVTATVADTAAAQATSAGAILTWGLVTGTSPSPSPSATAAPSPSPSPTTTPSAGPSPSPSVSPTTAPPTAAPSPTAPRPTPQPTRTATPSPAPRPTGNPQPTGDPAPTGGRLPATDPGPGPGPTTEPQPVASPDDATPPSASPSATASPTATPSPTVTAVPAVPQGGGGTGEGGTGAGSGSGSGKRDVLHRLYLTAAGLAQHSGFPVVLLVVVLLFIAFQNRLDDKDPKLALAPIHREPMLRYLPPPDPFQYAPGGRS